MYIDLAWEARTNGEFRSKLTKLTKEIAELEQRQDRDPMASDAVAQRVVDVYRLCKYNAGFLVPYFFPQYPYDTPLSCNNRPYSFAMYHFQIGGFVVFRAGRQIGKFLPHDTRLVTPEGWKPMGDIKVGDWVVDENGAPTKVKAVHPQGVQDVYRMTFTDGSSVECGLDHLWKCKKGGKDRPWMTKSLKEILERKGGFNPNSDQGIRIPLTKPVQFPGNGHYIPSYVLGLLIGDGSLTCCCRFTTNDEELLKYAQEEMPELIQHRVTPDEVDFKVELEGKTSPLLREIRRLELNVTSEHKHIPYEYLYDSIENRIALLRGLMDTDGSIYGNCQMEYYTSSFKLAGQVRELVQSLGGTAKIVRKETYYKKNGKRVPCKTCFRVKIKIQDINPFRLKRKADKFYNIRYEKTRVLKRVEYSRTTECSCIEVESDCHTYLTEDYIVTHNSTGIGGRQLIHAHIIPKFKSMYVTPHQEFLNTYANRLREMERCFRFYQHHKDYRQNLKFKEYPNGSQLYLIKCLTDTAEARGKTSDELLFDEAQLLDPYLLADIEQCQKASLMPSTVYAGTATTVESLLETKYMDSSQGYWFVRASGWKSETAGENWINMGDQKDILAMMTPRGPVNPATGNALDVGDGRFVHKERHMYDRGRIGFHIPQVIIPEFAMKPRKWQEIWDAYQDYDIKKFMQEVMGIPSEEGEREITLQDLKDMCVLEFNPKNEDEVAAVARKNYRFIISGCDWGGSDYNPADRTKVSYTVHVMIGITPENKIHILRMQQYSGMDYRDIIDDITNYHVKYNGMAIATDFGVGAAYNMLIREHPKIPPERHFIFGYVGPMSAPLRAPASGPGWFNQYSLNRTESISALYAAIKDGEVLCYDWNVAEDRLLELLNLFRIPSETATGVQAFRYQRHGAKADDTLHALNFAFVIARLFRHEPIVEDKALKERFAKMLTGRPPEDPFWGPGMGGVISG